MKKVLFLLFISFNLGFSQNRDSYLNAVSGALSNTLVGGKKIRFSQKDKTSNLSNQNTDE